MKACLLLLTLLTSSLVEAGFESPVIIDPPNPKVGDEITVGVHTIYYPPCLILPLENTLGQTHEFINVDNQLNLNLLASNDPFCNPFPVTPAPREYYSLGSLPEGDYSLQVGFYGYPLSLTGQIQPFPLSDRLNQFGPVIQFSVFELPEATPVSLGSQLYWLMIILLIIVLSIHKISRNVVS